MPTLDEVIFEAAARSALVFSSTCTATGSAGADSQLIDAELLDTAQDPTAFSGGWIYRPNATDSTDRLRRMSDDGFNTSTGALIPRRNWTVAPANGEAYQMYSLIPPYDEAGATMVSWHRLVNRGLENMQTVAEWVVGRGQGLTRPLRWPLDRQEVTLIAAIAVAGGSGVTITAPTGWTLIGSSVTSGTDIRLSVYKKRSLLSDPIDWTWTLSGSAQAAGVIVPYQDASVTDPEDTNSTTTATPAATSITAPSVTTAAGGEVVLRIVASATAAAFTTNDDTLAERIDVVSEEGEAQVGLAVFDSTEGPAGASGTAVLIPSSSVIMATMTLALNVRDVRRRTVYAGDATFGENGTAGDDEITVKRPLNLPNDDWVPNREHIRKVFIRRAGTGHAGELQTALPYARDMAKGGRWWDVERDAGRQTLVVSTAPGGDEELVLVVQRPYVQITAPAEITDCPLQLAALRTRYEFFHYLNTASQSRGEYDREEAASFKDWSDEWREHQPTRALIGVG